MLPVILIFAAPAIHSTLCILRVLHRFPWSIALISFLMIIVGFAFSAFAAELVFDDVPVVPHQVRCGTIGTAFLIGGCFITLISVTFSGLIFASIYQLNDKSKQPNSAPAAHSLN